MLQVIISENHASDEHVPFLIVKSKDPTTQTWKHCQL